MGTPTSASKTTGLVRRYVVRALQATGLNTVASDLYYRHLHGFQSASTGLDEGFEEIFVKAKEIGSFQNAAIYCEFGLFKGYSFWKAQDLVKRLGIEGVRFLGFDSFEGLPEPEGLDAKGKAEFRKGQYACSLEAVRASLTKAGVDWERTQLVKGYFRDTLAPDRIPGYGVSAVGVAMIDCDLYHSTVDVFEFLKGRLRHNSILIMDDWNCFGGDDNLGQRRALREFLATQPGMSVKPLCCYGANSQAFIVAVEG